MNNWLAAVIGVIIALCVISAGTTMATPLKFLGLLCVLNALVHLGRKK